MRDPSKWIMLLDAFGTGGYMYSPNEWILDTDFDSDGIKDSNSGVLNAGGPVYNGAKPFVHQDSCNIGMPDGHVERMGQCLHYRTIGPASLGRRAHSDGNRARLRHRRPRTTSTRPHFQDDTSLWQSSSSLLTACRRGPPSV